MVVKTINYSIFGLFFFSEMALEIMAKMSSNLSFLRNPNIS